MPRPERPFEFSVDVLRLLLLVFDSVEWEECFLQVDCGD